jgi:succinate dehydrogenase/fumarate reductase flavoprotein subunit
LSSEAATAGCRAAIAASETGASVILADKGRVGTSGATAAANTAVIDVPSSGPAHDEVIERRLARGFGLARGDWVERMIDETHVQLGRLAEWGYTFARDDHGVIYRGALLGPDYMQILRRRLLKAGVRLLDHSPALHLLLTSDHEVAGASGLTREGKVWTVRSGAVVLAAGGCAFMSKALGTYGLTGDALLMGAEAGAVLSGMEFSGQYGVSHAVATVTKNLIFDWATFSDSSGRILEGEDIFELLARHLPAGPVYAIIDKAPPSIQEGLRRGQPNILLPLDRQGIDPFRQRFPVALRYEGTVRGVGGLMIDVAGATSVPGLFAAGDAAYRSPWLAQRAAEAVPTRLGRSPLAPLRDAQLRRAPMRLDLDFIEGTRRQGMKELAKTGLRSTRVRRQTTSPPLRLRCFRSNETLRGTPSV